MASVSADMRRMREDVDALLRVELHRLDSKPFYKDHVARKITNRYDVPGKTDPRVWHLLYAFTSGRLGSILHREREAGERIYECYSTPDGKRWQTARAFTVKHLRSVVKDYQERYDDLGEKVVFLADVLAEAERQRLDEDETIHAAWDAVLRSRGEYSEAA